LRRFLSNDFNDILWKNKILCLYHLITDLNNLHELGYFHKNLHSGNILQNDNITYISDFGLYGPIGNEQKSVNKIYGVLPYIAPEVLNGGSYTLSSDIYSFGIIMTELSSGRPPFHDRKHDKSLSVAICNGLRPEFGKGTPEIYKKLAYKCMDANPKQRPTAKALYKTFDFWFDSINKRKEIKIIFDEADKEIPNISISYEKDQDSVYISRAFKFEDLPNPINSPHYNNESNEGTISDICIKY
jgi:serine/threonine protein kinase